MNYARKCYTEDGNWAGCWGDYDHSDRGLLILAVIATIVITTSLVLKFKARRKIE